MSCFTVIQINYVPLILDVPIITSDGSVADINSKRHLRFNFFYPNDRLEHVVRYFLFISVISFMNSCSLQPPYHRPPIDLPKKWPHAVHQKTSEINLKKMRWWRQYHHPTLNRLIIRAIHENNDLKKSIANIEYAQKELTQVKLNWLPNASLLGGISQFPIFANPGGFVMAAPLYVINILQQYQQQQSNQALLVASIYAKDAATLMVISQVATSYFTLIAEKESLILYRQLLQDMQRYHQLLQTQHRSGLISEDDVMMVHSRIETIWAQLMMVEHNIVVSQNALHALLNENPGEFSIHDSFKTLNSQAVIPANLPLNVIQNRPDVRQQEALLRSAYANVGTAIASLFPTMTIGAYLGSGTTSHGPFRLLEAYPSLPIDLSLYAQISASKAQFKALCFSYLNTVRIALRDVDDSLSLYRQHTMQLQHLKTALKNASLHCGWTKKRFQHGLADQIEVRRCQIRLDELHILINQTKLEKMLSVVKLYQDLAGGYDVV
jgi:multidrug efflux system outer membrane protein